MSMKKARTAIIASALVGCLAIGGISAYFTDADTATNTFTVGKVEIDLQEPKWTPPEDITPDEEFKKDPKIVNTGNNESYVFMEVVVPYANVITANEDGTRNEAADTELFSYTVNTGWVEVGTAEKDTTAKTVTHLYAYGTSTAMTGLAKDAETPALFNAVKFANVVEDQNLEGTKLNVVVNAYAIQSANINNGDTAIDGTNTTGKVAPADVWLVIQNQNLNSDGDFAPDTSKDGLGTEDANTDVLTKESSK